MSQGVHARASSAVVMHGSPERPGMFKCNASETSVTILAQGNLSQLRRSRCSKQILMRCTVRHQPSPTLVSTFAFHMRGSLSAVNLSIVLNVFDYFCHGRVRTDSFLKDSVSVSNSLPLPRMTNVLGAGLGLCAYGNYFGFLRARPTVFLLLWTFAAFYVS